MIYEHLWALRPGGSSALLFRFISLLAKGLNQLSWLTNHLRGGAVPNGHLAILPVSVIIPGEHQPWLQTCRTPLAGLTLVSRVTTRALRVYEVKPLPKVIGSVYDRDKGAHLRWSDFRVLLLTTQILPCVISHSRGKSEKWRTMWQERESDALIERLGENYLGKGIFPWPEKS